MWCNSGKECECLAKHPSLGGLAENKIWVLSDKAWTHETSCCDIPLLLGALVTSRTLRPCPQVCPEEGLVHLRRSKVQRLPRFFAINNRTRACPTTDTLEGASEGSREMAVVRVEKVKGAASDELIENFARAVLARQSRFNENIGFPPVLPEGCVSRRS